MEKFFHDNFIFFREKTFKAKFAEKQIQICFVRANRFPAPVAIILLIFLYYFLITNIFFMYGERTMGDNHHGRSARFKISIF